MEKGVGVVKGLALCGLFLRVMLKKELCFQSSFKEIALSGL